jgi:putative DNA methylase
MAQAIEHSFPFEELNRIAALESWRKEIHRPLSHVHKWWATRLGSVFRTILLGGLLNKDDDTWKHFYEEHNFVDTVVLDPFMGSGTTVTEALKLGCRVVGSDINPVSYFLVREALRAVSPERLTAAFEKLKQRVQPSLRSVYTSTWEKQPADLLYTFWVKTISCPDCGEVSRLFSNWIFSANAYPGRKPASRCLCPACGEILVIRHQDASTKCSCCSHRFNPQEGPARRSSFVCEHCRKEHPIAATYRRTLEPPTHAMFALLLLLPGGEKVYKRPDQNDFDAYNTACKKLRSSRVPYPREEIPAGVNTDQARGYNYLRWSQMFNDRQLYALGMLLREILKEPDIDVRRQFLLLFSGTLEFNNMFCSFKGEGTGAVRHLFTHHILKPERTPLENNPWGTEKSSGTFSTLFHRRLLSARDYAARPFEIRATRKGAKDMAEKIYGVSLPVKPRVAESLEEFVAKKADAFIRCGDSSQLPLPSGSVDLVVTDPPYFDNVHYSELADFFHVWLRLGLKDTDAAFREETTRSDREVQATCPHDFAQMLGDVFRESVRVLKPEGLLIFTFHHSREDAWSAVLSAVCGAGLRVVATHPIKGEMSVAAPKSQAKEPIDIDSIIICKRATVVGRNGLVVKDWPENAAAVIRRFNESGISLSKGDVRVVVMGEFLKAATTGVNGELSPHAFTGSIDGLHGAQHVHQKIAVKREEPRTLFDALTADARGR